MCELAAGTFVRWGGRYAGTVVRRLPGVPDRTGMYVVKLESGAYQGPPIAQLEAANPDRITRCRDGCKGP